MEDVHHVNTTFASVFSLSLFVCRSVAYWTARAAFYIHKESFKITFLNKLFVWFKVK